MQINPVAWVIYSTTENEIRAFIYENEDIKEVGIKRITARA
jgi:hypothetical protein